MGERRYAGSSRRRPARPVLEELALATECLDPKMGMTPGKLLAWGSFGSVWELLSTTDGTVRRWVLKVSLLSDRDQIDTFDREVYFLDRLKSTQLVPVLRSSGTCKNARGQTLGIQVMERFDSSWEDLGKRQAKSLGLASGKVAFKPWQIDRLLELVNRFDEHKILHGDLRRSNILQSGNGERVVVADFGFSGAPNTPYMPLLGFVKRYNCPGTMIFERGSRSLKTPIPYDLANHFNRWSIWKEFFSGRPMFLIRKNKALEKLGPKHVAQKLDLSPAIIERFRRYCRPASPESPPTAAVAQLSIAKQK